jgi:hypothetical protein
MFASIVKSAAEASGRRTFHASRAASAKLGVEGLANKTSLTG